MARQRLRKRVFKALREGWKQGYRYVEGTPVSAKEVTRPVVAAMEWEGAAFIDDKLRSGRLDTENWGLEDGQSQGL